MYCPSIEIWWFWIWKQGNSPLNFSKLWLNWIFRSFDPEQDDEGSRGPSNSSGPSSSNNGGNNIQTFSVTIETTGNSPIKPKKFFQQKSASETEIQEPLFNVIHPLSDVKINDNCLALNRSRRQIKKKKTHYCDHCRMDYDTGWFLLNFYQKWLWNIRSMLKSSTFWFFEP